MIHGRVPVSNATSARAPRGAWKGLRALFLMLTAALWAAARLAPGSLKASSLRLLARHVGTLEHGLRCLLLLMRGASACMHAAFACAPSKPSFRPLRSGA